jgi:hypothetical protein
MNSPARKLSIANMVADLVPFAPNARTPSNSQIEQIAASILKFG